MRLASFLNSADPDHAERRRRLVSMALTIAIHIALLLLLLTLAPPLKRIIKSGGMQLITFSTTPDAQEQTARSSTSKTHRAHPTAQPPAAVVPPPKIVLPDKAAPWVLTPGLERFDVRQLPQAQAPRQQASDASATDEANADSGDHPAAYGPGGLPLYDVDWYREPTGTELAFYLKKARPGPGFALIGCRTAARYHVVDCFPIDETPGSGLARAMVEASWQFQVLPPRIGTRQQLGTGVRIRFDFTEKKDR